MITTLKIDKDHEAIVTDGMLVTFDNMKNITSISNHVPKEYQISNIVGSLILIADIHDKIQLQQYNLPKELTILKRSNSFGAFYPR